jgi:hypothetical protein
VTAINTAIGKAVYPTSTGIPIGKGSTATAIRSSNVSTAPKEGTIQARSEIAPFAGKAVEEAGASRDKNIPVEEELPAAPVEAPGRPTPAVSPEKPKPNRRTEEKLGTNPGIENEAWPHSQGRSVNGPRIVNRQVANVGNSRLDDDRRPLRGYGLLRRALQSSCILGSLAHDLNCVEHILLLIEIGVADC